MSETSLVDATPAQAKFEEDRVRRFWCPACSSIELRPVVEAKAVARCDACSYEIDDLLSLVPVHAVPLHVVVLGTGPDAVLRLAGLIVVVLGLASLVLVGR